MIHRLLAAALALSLGACSPAPPDSPEVPSPAPGRTASPAPAGSVAARTDRRSVVILSRKAGTAVTKHRGDGSFEFSYEHLDNGRGPIRIMRSKDGSCHTE